MGERGEFRLKLGKSHIEYKCKSLEKFRDGFPPCDVKFNLRGPKKTFRTYVDRANRIRLNSLLDEYPDTKAGDIIVFTPISNSKEWKVKIEKSSLPAKSGGLQKKPVILDISQFVEEQEYYFKQINKAIGFKEDGPLQKGILLIPKGKRSALMIRINLKSNLYDEEYNPGSDELYYIGQGLPGQGHQTATRGNKRILDNLDKDLHVFVQDKEQRSGYWTYEGIWKVVDYDSEYKSNQILLNGENQRVFRFKLRRKIPISKSEIESNWDAIGILLKLGNLLGYSTFTTQPNRSSNGKKLQEWATLEKIPATLTRNEEILKVDVIWFLGVKPKLIFQVEHRNRMRDTLYTLHKLRKKGVGFIVIGPNSSKMEYDRWVVREPVSEIANCCRFRSYDQLLKLMNDAAEYFSSRDLFFEKWIH